MLIGMPLLEATDWGKLGHAYGRATNTPDHIRALLGTDKAAIAEAQKHLWYAVIHQGTPWSVTGTVGKVIAGLMFDPTYATNLIPVRDNLVNFLGAFVAACSELSPEQVDQFLPGYSEELETSEGEISPDEMNSWLAHSVKGCRDAIPGVVAAVRQGLSHPEYSYHVYASKVGASVSTLNGYEYLKVEIIAKMRDLANTASGVDERAAYVLALGELGETPIEFLLEDSSQKVRLCAALAPGLAKDETAQQVLIDALVDSADVIDKWFDCPPPQFYGLVRYHVVRHLSLNIANFSRMVDAAVAVIRTAKSEKISSDWGYMLGAAFPDVDGVIKTPAQRKFVEALVANPNVWDISTPFAGSGSREAVSR